MFIRSERLFLRPGWLEDGPELLAQIADEAIVRNLARAPWPYTTQDAHGFLALPAEPRLPRMLITRPGTAGADIVGGIGLERSDQGVELGYWIGRDHWGNGYASEAVCAMLSLARALGHDRVVASHFIDNPASGRVLEKTGFRRTGGMAERFGLARGISCPTREYEFRLVGEQHSDGLMCRKQAA